MLAQAILLWIRPINPSRGVMVQHFEDRDAAGSTTHPASAAPYCQGLLALCAVCIKRRVQAHLTSRRRDRNDWAMKLSRMNDEHGSFRGCLDPAKEHKIDLADFLSCMQA
jgi:hypothetical protein